MDDKSPRTDLARRLQASEESLDRETLEALRARREQALQMRSPVATRESSHWQGWLLAASVAVIAVLVALPELDRGEAANLAALEEGPQEDIDLYENLEFYQWLAAQEGDLG